MTRGNAGFTLIEVLIAVAIVGILLAVGLPAYQEQIAKGKRSEGKSALLKTIQLQERNYTARGRYTTDLGPLWGLGPGAEVRSGENPEDANGWYVITADTTGCNTADLQVCVNVVATPRPGYDDPNCNVLSLNSRGVQAKTGTRDLAYCWGR
jgi:type IV pilus assembly protein PilE